MILVDWQIKQLLEKEELIIDPLEESQIGPASVDLTLGNEKMTFMPQTVYFNNESFIKAENINIIGERHTIFDDAVLEIGPKEFALFHTKETIKLDVDLVGQLEGRSSVGRQGLFIHNAGYIDPGFAGQLTLELFNATDSSLLLPVGMKICQLVLQHCKVPDVPYNRRTTSKYMNQTGVTASKLEKEFETLKEEF